MTEKQIKAADLIIKHTTFYGTDISNHYNRDSELSGEIRKVGEYLKEDGLIEIHVHAAVPGRELYKLTTKGMDFQATGKSFADYREEKERQKSVSEERAKIQQKSQESVLRRNTRAEWQYWVTTIIAVIALLLHLKNCQ